MSLGFPDAPTAGQTFTAQNGVTYTWDGVVWEGSFYEGVGPVRLAGAVYASDGAVMIALPDWFKVDAEEAYGDGVSIENGDVRVLADPPQMIEMRILVLHSYGRHVVFGVSVNGAAIIEYARVQVNSNEPVFVSTRRQATFHRDDLISFYISSDFAWEDFEWSQAEFDLVQGLP